MSVSLWFEIDLEHFLNAYSAKENLAIYSKPLNKFSNQVKKHDNVAIVSYASGAPVYYSYQAALELSAHDNGIDRILTYHPRDIDLGFYNRHKAILDLPRGVGYWLWKPYIILDAMKRMPEGSYVFYIDRDCFVLGDITPLLKLADKYNRVLFMDGYNNRNYIKRDAYILMNADSDEIYNGKTIAAGYLILKNNKKNRDFIEEWLKYCTNVKLLTDTPSMLGKELTGFFDHRHDQAILTLLASKYSKNEQYLLPIHETGLYLYNNNNRKKNMFIYSLNRRMQEQVAK